MDNWYNMYGGSFIRVGTIYIFWRVHSLSAHTDTCLLAPWPPKKSSNQEIHLLLLGFNRITNPHLCLVWVASSGQLPPPLRGQIEPGDLRKSWFTAVFSLDAWSSLSCYTSSTAWDVELCQHFLLAGSFLEIIHLFTPWCYLFKLLYWLPKPRLKTPVCLIILLWGKEWIHAFFKVSNHLKAKSNADNKV